jgi:hypothetical protein
MTKRAKAPCGTRAAYQWHRRRQENCTVCKQANTNHYAAKRPKTVKIIKVPKGQINRQMVRQFKFDAGSCMDCGFIVDERTIVCFDLDHRDPQTKSFTISYEMDSASPNDMRDEIAKCDVVCRNCHAIRTHEAKHHLVRREKTTTHLSLFD